MRDILTHHGSSEFELTLLSVFYNVKYNAYCDGIMLFNEIKCPQKRFNLESSAVPYEVNAKTRSIS